MKLVGIDPSFNRTGISIYKNGKLTITSKGYEGEKIPPTFQNIWRKAGKLSLDILNVIKPNKNTIIISEVPPPQGQYSPALWCLDSMLFDALQEFDCKIYNLPPTYLGHVHGKRKYSKSESVVLANSILAKIGIDVDIQTKSGKLNHDSAESFVMLCRLFVIKGMYLEELRDWRGFFSEKEKILEPY